MSRFIEDSSTLGSSDDVASNDGFDLSDWTFDNVVNNNPWQGTNFQSTIGDASISRPTIDGFMGQVYLNTQTFSGQYQPTAISLYATTVGNYITPLVFAVNQTSNGATYTLAAVYQPIHIDQAGQTTKPLSLLAGTANGTTTYVFGYTDQQLTAGNGTDLSAKSVTSGTINYENTSDAGTWLATEVGANSPVSLTIGSSTFSQTPANGVVTAFPKRTYSASIILGTNQLQGVVTQQVGDPPINHSQTDTFVGQVYIDSQTFSGTLNPSSVSFFANFNFLQNPGGHFLTPLVFSVSNGVYTVAAVYQSIEIGEFGPETIGLTLVQGYLDPSQTYAFGYSDRQVSANGDTLTTVQTNPGSVGYDNVSGGNWMATEISSGSPDLGLTQTFSTSGNNGATQLFTGRTYGLTMILVTPNAQNVQQLGDTLINRGNTDTQAGQVYISSQTFSGVSAAAGVQFLCGRGRKLCHAVAVLRQRRQLHFGCYLSIDPGAAGRLRFRLDEASHRLDRPARHVCVRLHGPPG